MNVKSLGARWAEEAKARSDWDRYFKPHPEPAPPLSPAEAERTRLLAEAKAWERREAARHLAELGEAEARARREADDKLVERYLKAKNGPQ